MKNYEVTFIVDPVLSGEEVKSTAQTYVDHLSKEGCSIVNVDEMGLRGLAYPINKRTSGNYFCIEFQSESGDFLEKMELAFRRDERIIRFLTVKLDKYGIKYNADKRAGLIGKKKSRKEATPVPAAPAPVAPAPVAPAPTPVAKPVEKVAAPAPVVEEEE
ncbi:MAG TPA: 30S ribosomal protein S6 [Saprospiraceae bacterium]|nr:30S ribosomal protein S6 [Saprospiraceae bacterium]HMQ81499.1 30S ribosomal protein S6 [Saprospiraceae bacterium]